jgi:hypothetical protein
VPGPEHQTEHQQRRGAEHEGRHVVQRRGARIGLGGCLSPSPC